MKQKKEEKNDEIMDFKQYAMEKHRILDENINLPPDERLKTNQAIYAELKNTQIIGNYISIDIFKKFKASEIPFLKNELPSIIRKHIREFKIDVDHEKKFIDAIVFDFFNNWHSHSDRILKDAIVSSKKNVI